MTKTFFVAIRCFSALRVAKSVFQKVVECQVGVFDQVCAVFTATAWSSSCLGNFEPCLHPQCAVVLNVCTHNGPQCPLLFLCGSFLCKPPQPSIHWHSTTTRPRRWHCKCSTLKPSVQLEEQHLPLLVGTSEVPPPVQHNAKPGSLCR